MISTYTATTSVENTDGVIDFAVAHFTNNGFAITQRGEDSVSLTGPGMYSTNQNPILGVSKVILALRGRTLVADAELGGVDAMQRFILRFPFVLCLALGLLMAVGGGFLFGGLFGVGFGVPWAHDWQWILLIMSIAMLPAAPWLVLSPLMAIGIRRRTQRALETIVRNAAFRR